MTVTYNPEQGLQQVAAGLKRVAFDPIVTLNGFDYPVAAPPLDAGIVIPPEINYRVAMSVGVVQLDFELWIIVGSSAGHEQQKTLWPFLNWAGPKSILALIDADRSLGIVGADGQPRVNAHVASTRRITLDEMPPFETQTFGVAFEVPVTVTNRE